MKRSYKSHRRLSENQLRIKLEKSGWTVWRGGYLNCLREDELYPNAYRKYSMLYDILEDRLDFLQYLCVIHHGMPDFLCYRKGELKFVECKLGNEQLSNAQKKCIAKLQENGFRVEVHKFVFHSTKIREANVDIISNSKEIIKKQERLKLHYKNHKPNITAETRCD
jgi:hypothetical protein